ncbi:aminotransferase class IV [Taibaiella koreensis]|uniref:aminotransferase class IV n=1 Tax=Taibaiella koreensis TaxID=1268548 RepID=UPI000E59CDB4|nr:aminotransferase class IV [Taibaiella koreensis]
MPLLNYNGVICSDEELLITVRNRALRYGEGLIETMLWQDGNIRRLQLHEKRAADSLALLGFPAIEPEVWHKALHRTLLAHQDVKTGILRTQFFRDDSLQTLQYMIELLPLPTAHGAWPERGLYTGICRTAVKASDQISHLKTTSRLCYIVAGREAAQQGWDDAFLLNPAGRIAESTISNIWIIKDGAAITPPLSEGCIAGVFRTALLKNESIGGITLRQGMLTEQDLQEADEIFLTNTIRGIQPVSRFNGREYSSTLTRNLFEQSDAAL